MRWTGNENCNVSEINHPFPLLRWGIQTGSFHFSFPTWVMGQNKATRNWTAGFGPCFHLPGSKPFCFGVALFVTSHRFRAPIASGQSHPSESPRRRRAQVALSRRSRWAAALQVFRALRDDEAAADVDAVCFNAALAAYRKARRGGGGRSLGGRVQLERWGVPLVC